MHESDLTADGFKLTFTKAIVRSPADTSSASSAAASLIVETRRDAAPGA